VCTRKWIWFVKLRIFIASGVVLENSSMAAELVHIALDICKGLYSHILANNEASLLINSQKCMLLSQRLLEAQETLQTVHLKLEMNGPESLSTLMELAMQELVHVLLKAQKTVLLVKNGWNRLSGKVETGRKLLVKFYMTYNGYVASSASRWDKTARFFN
jgi:hypothetical protein